MPLPETAQAFWVTRPGEGEIRTESLAPLTVDHVHVRTLYSGVSRGTESLVFNARVPESEYARMRAPFQDGEFPTPVKYGYCSVGVVDEGPESLLNARVFCLYPHQSRYVVPVEAVLPLPDDVPAARAVLAANMETAVNGVWDANPRLGETLCVVGAGVVGALVAYLCARIPGVNVHLIDIDPQRRSLAHALGVNFATPDSAPREQDCVIHASGHGEGLKLGLSLLGREGRLIEMSWFGEGETSLSLGGAFHSQRLSIKASQVGQLPADMQPRWDYRRRLALALRLLDDPVLDQLISGECTLEEFPALAPELLGPGSRALCHRIAYPDND
ncbi:MULTISPECIES: zinc-binding alcohol dehydrogenase [unclassified Halomonas]|uniref:zinc-dependent alcohol dehydrogenase n=1 Tax=unclassified Halomonas TaxID=2609666 RepID=UPI00209DBEF5|nr:MULTISPECIES: zinc-binding alcohol dehydrogenase [unclassified Halomonas]MCP1314243.1 zinc-binding alcohol dehydrogenase [Halomonas sp. 707D7]MCP1326376.1 zinc-binding alcohol dehydrogenase [Halomonas sp. 707D4]